MAHHFGLGEREQYEREIKYVHDMLFVDTQRPIPGTNLYINRNPHPYVYHDEAVSYDELLARQDEFVQKGKGRALERGFKTRDVSGQGNEALYRAISKGLKGTEDWYKEIYQIGILQMGLDGLPASSYDLTPQSFNKYVMEEDISGLHFVEPQYVLGAFANAMSVKIVLFNAVGKTFVGQEFAPFTAGTEIEHTAYALCFPNAATISSVPNALALAAEPILPRLLQNDLPNQPTDALIRMDRIWRQNTIPELQFRPPVDTEEEMIKRIKARPGIFDFSCLYKDALDEVEWVPPLLGI